MEVDAAVGPALNHDQAGTSDRASATRVTPLRRSSSPSNTVTWEATVPAVRGTGVPVTMNPSSSMGRIWPMSGWERKREEEGRKKPGPPDRETPTSRVESR